MLIFLSTSNFNFPFNSDHRVSVQCQLLIYLSVFLFKCPFYFSNCTIPFNSESHLSFNFEFAFSLSTSTFSIPFNFGFQLFFRFRLSFSLLFSNINVPFTLRCHFSFNYLTFDFFIFLLVHIFQFPLEFPMFNFPFILRTSTFRSIPSFKYPCNDDYHITLFSTCHIPSSIELYCSF